MYSGTTLTPLSGRLLGAHQKIDRLARASLQRLLPADTPFPDIRRILHFEGVNGPDAIKRKSPAQDEPWHFYAPFDEHDTQLLDIIDRHYDTLVATLKQHDTVRSAFEAAWLAHAIVDGLTPPHHHPYEAELVALRGEGIHTRTTLKDKIFMPGATPLKRVRNNWKMWGPHGLLAAHGFFEWGAAIIIKPVTEKQVRLTQADIAELHDNGVLELFRRKAKEIDALGMYDAYHAHGWNRTLVRQTRQTLIPVIVHTVALTWYAACIDAGLAERRRP